MQVLGTVRVDGVELAGPRVRRLLTSLVLADGRVLSLRHLAQDVWGDDAPADPAGALQALVSRVRRMTGLPVQAVAGGYRIPADAVHVDAVALRSALAGARDAVRRGQADEAATLARESLAGWEGYIGDGYLGKHVPVTQAVALRAASRELLLLWADTLIHALTHSRTVGYDDVLSRLEAACAANPFDEPLAAALLRLLVVSGRPAQALQRFEDVRRHLDRLGADPSRLLREAHALALDATADDAGPVTARSPAPNPALIGREADLDALVARVDQHTLVTLVGPGGVGKTSLVRELAATWRRRGEAVHEAPLAGLREGADVVSVIIAALGGARRTGLDAVRPGSSSASASGAGAPGDDELRRVVALSRGLLVLDNCEHLLDAVADAALAVCAAAPPSLRVVATSRAPLGVLDEHVQPLLPLADHAALALLQGRAAAVRPGAELATGTLSQVCARLDNLPLALELVAARLRTMTADDVLAGLADRFSLLADGPRGLPDRHRSLEALIGWSWDLLSAPERALLRRLSVFPAGASATTVVTVCADDALPAGADLPADAVLPALSGLVDASLVVLDEPTGGGPGRYRLLETVREYAEGHLAEGQLNEGQLNEGQGGVDERDLVQAALAAWCVRVAEGLLPDLEGPGQVRALGVVTAERDALAASLRWSVARGVPDVSVPLGLLLVHSAALRGQHAEALEWVCVVHAGTDPLTSRSPQGRTLDGARTWTWAATTSLIGLVNAAGMGQLRTLAQCLVRLRHARTRPDLLPPGFGDLAEALTALVRGQEDRARAALEQAVQIDGPWQPWTLLMRAWTLENGGLGDLGLGDARAAHARFLAVGHRAGQGTAASVVAERLAGLGRPQEALVWWAEAEDAAAAIGAEGEARQARVFALRTRAEMAAGDAAAQAALNAEIETLARTFPDDDLVQYTYATALVEAALAAGDIEAARAACRAAATRLQQSAAAGSQQVRAIVLAGAAVVEVEAGALQEAQRMLGASISHVLSTRDVPAQAMVGEAVAMWAARVGRPSLAQTLLALADRFGAHLTPVVPGLGSRPRRGAPEVTPAVRAAIPAAPEQAVALLRELLADAFTPCGDRPTGPAA